MKTIEEAVKELYPLNKPTMYTQFVAGLEQSAFKAGVEFAQRWIPVEEELPEICDFYLTKQSDNIKPHVYYYDGEYKGFFHGKGIQIFTITYWRPIEIK